MSDPRTFTVVVTQRVKVSLDADKFDAAFMAEFRESFFPYFDLEDHAKHLAQLVARGVYELSPYIPTEFVEGYAEIGPMGISAKLLDCDEEIEPEGSHG